MAKQEEYTLGVEEEYQLVDPETGALRSRADRVLPEVQEEIGEEAQHEVHLSQVEAITPVCRTLAEVRSEIVRLRGSVIEAAKGEGLVAAAAGTHPFSDWRDQAVTPKPRYQGLVRDYGQIMRDLVIFGCHVHIGLEDPELGVEVLNRTRASLAPLLALAASSPYWLGADTGYASYRTALWSRMPMSGPPAAFGSREEYDGLIGALVSAGVIKDSTNIYWDIRLPAKVPTVEFRVTDVCTLVDEAVLIAGLARALVRTSIEQAALGEPYLHPRPELVRAAQWRAARYGLEGELIDVRAQQTIPAGELIGDFLSRLRDALEAAGDWDEVSSLVRRTLEEGNSATRQRRAYERRGRMEDVVDLVSEETARGVVPG